MSTTFLSNKFQLSNKKGERAAGVGKGVFGHKPTLMAKLFGCRHKNISRPFAEGETAYRSCLDCGARRQFNIETLETQGSFYFPMVVENQRLELR